MNPRPIFVKDIVVVVVVDDDTYYWVYLSSDHLFQVYYKVRQYTHIQCLKDITSPMALGHETLSFTKMGLGFI